VILRKFIGEELVIGSHNKGKLAEFKKLFLGRNIKLYSAADFNLDDPEETGKTFIENAILKAKFVAKTTGKPAIADDSGFCVDVLGGDPGLHTARWAEKNNDERDFNMAMEKVHNKMKGSDNKKCHFNCALALCWPDGHYEVVEGIANGNMIWPPRGKGFGFDPIFIHEDYDITYGEMEESESDVKHKISHRADAFKKMIAKCFSN